MRTLNWELLKETYNEWNRHGAAQLGAALAYYSILSLAPLIILLIAILELLYGAEAARGDLALELRRFMGFEAAQAVQRVVASANAPSSGVIATVVGIVTLLFGASGAVIALQQALNTIWDVPHACTSGGGDRTCVRSSWDSQPSSWSG